MNKWAHLDSPNHLTFPQNDNMMISYYNYYNHFQCLKKYKNMQKRSFSSIWTTPTPEIYQHKFCISIHVIIKVGDNYKKKKKMMFW